MKTLFILFVVLIGLTACSIPRVVDFSKIQITNGIAYCINEDKPFTGTFIEIYENGQKKSEGNFKDGEFDGKVTSWHENGQKQSEGNFMDGKQITWYENGQKKSETNYKDGKKEGKYIKWSDNGQIEREEYYKDGKLQE